MDNETQEPETAAVPELVTGYGSLSLPGFFSPRPAGQEPGE